MQYFWVFLASMVLCTHAYGVRLIDVDFENRTNGTYTETEIEQDFGDSTCDCGSGVDRGNANIITENGNKALDITYVPRDPSDNNPNGTGSDDAAAFRIDLPTNHNELFLQYRIFFPSDWNPPKNGKLPGLCGGDNDGGSNGCPNGGDDADKGFTSRYQFRNPNERREITLYLYHRDKPGTTGHNFPVTSPFQRGVWHTIRQRIVMNTPGQFDGIAQVWFNGNPEVNLSNIRYRASNQNFLIEEFFFSTFHGGADPSHATTVEQHIRFDDIIVATQASDFDSTPAPLPDRNLAYGPSNESSCLTTQQPGTTSLIIVPDDTANLEAAVENNTSTTVLVKSSGSPYTVNNFEIGNNNFVAQFNCEPVTVTVNARSTITSSDNWVIRGLDFDCQNRDCLRVSTGSENWQFTNNNVRNADKGFYVVETATGGLVEGNFIEGCESCQPSDLVVIANGGSATTFKRNRIISFANGRNCPGQPHVVACRGNDMLSLNGVGPGNVITENIFERPDAMEQFIDLKNSTGQANGVEISYNTFIGPFLNRGRDEGQDGPSITVGDALGCDIADTCPAHHIHHNYHQDTRSTVPSAERATSDLKAYDVAISNQRTAKVLYEYNISNQTRIDSTHDAGVGIAKCHECVFRRNTFEKGFFSLEDDLACSNVIAGSPVNLEFDNNLFHNIILQDVCSEIAPDWSFTNNVESDIFSGGGIDANHLDSGNSTDILTFINTGIETPDFTVTTTAHNQKGPLPSPTVSSAEIDPNCRVTIDMTTFAADGHDHGPLDRADTTKIDVKYDGAVQSQAVGAIARGLPDNEVILQMASCPGSGQTVTFDAEYGWCFDSANIGGPETSMDAGCLAVTGQAVTNNAGGPTGEFFVDVTCGTNGNGTSETCGATGPWNSFRNALDTAGCAGMSPGDILTVKGDATLDLTCENGGNCYFDSSVNPTTGCNGITIQEEENQHVVINGTTDIKNSTWTSVGGGVFQCTSGTCGTASRFPFTAWYDTGDIVERTLTLIQSNRTCDSSLAAGFMRYDPIAQQVCAHLHDGSSPASTRYFRIPTQSAFIIGVLEPASGITIRKNPVGTGSINIGRYRNKGIELDASMNTAWALEGLHFHEIMDRCVDMSGSIGPASFRAVNNTVNICGQEGIRWTSDTGEGVILNNTITNIQTLPTFERCQGVGAGCLSGFTDNGTAIRIVNHDGVSGIIRGNTILHFGGGKQGKGRGIDLEASTQNLIIENNYIAHSSNLALAGNAFLITGAFAGFDGVPARHQNNVIRNNFIFDVDVCLVNDTERDFPSMAGAQPSFFINNTCVDFKQFGVFADITDIDQDGLINVQNNIFVATNGSPTGVFIPSNLTTGWRNFFNNLFECDSCAVGTNFIDFKDTTFKLPGSCTPGTDCIEDWVVETIAGGNIEANSNLATSGDEPSLHLTATSEAIDAALALGLVPTDALGISRPQGAGPDIGAHEFTGTPPSFSLIQFGYQLYGRWMPEGQRPLVPESVSYPMYANSRFTLRIGVASESGASPNADYALFAQRCSPACTAFTQVTTDCSAANGICIVDNPRRTNRQNLSNRLGLSGRTFSTESIIIDADSLPVSISIGINEQAELEYSLGIGTQAELGDTIDLRIQTVGGNEIESYVQVPSITITKGRGTVSP